MNSKGYTREALEQAPNHISYRNWYNSILLVKRFVAAETGYHVNLNTELENELGLSGDLAWEFMERFGKVFDVNMEEFKLNFLKYFRPNSSYVSLLTLHLMFEIPVKAIQHLFKGNTQRFGEHLFDSKEYDLTIGDLVASVVKKKFCLREKLKRIR
ncbi:MAG: DUF1493 family protein [Flammeovirgaceae bacterium]|nr:MAG: DUF1493 family protein [Flammeovirgaceae bacterium]